MRRTIGSNIGNEPRLGALVEANELESYSFPQGVLSQLMREIAAGRPGLVTQVGLGTYVDPRQTGGKQNARTTEDLVEVVTLRGREWLLFHAFPIDVAVIRGTTADEDGNLTMEGEAVQGEMLAMAMAARNSGGIVIAQVRQLARRGSLPHARRQGARRAGRPRLRRPRPVADVHHAGLAVLRRARCASRSTDEPPLPLDVRKIIARRSLLEFPPGAICNLGFGISQLIGRVAWEEGITDQLVLTVEQGIFGGVPVAGNEGGAGFNYQAMIDQPYMFDFYDGGGLDVASLSFAEVDAEGNVNVHAFEGRVRGPGGFPNISAKTGKINFVGTLTAQGLELDIDDGVRVVEEGSLAQVRAAGPRDLVQRHGSRASAASRSATSRTARCSRSRTTGSCSSRSRPGIDVERDVLGRMGFRPRVADDLRDDRPRVYATGPMGLAADFGGGVVSGARRRSSSAQVAHLDARQPAAQPRRRASCSRSSTRRWRRSRRPTPGDVRAVVVTGAASGRSPPGRTSASSRRSAAPGGRERHELESGVAQPPRRPADADDRRDRGQRARRRAGARAVLRHPRRVGAREARAAGGPARRHARRRRDAAAAAGRRARRGPRS